MTRAAVRAPARYEGTFGCSSDLADVALPLVVAQASELAYTCRTPRYVMWDVRGAVRGRDDDAHEAPLA